MLSAGSLSLGQDFIDYLKQQQVITSVGLEDFADKFNFFFTVIVFFLCTTIITVKQYMFKPISCYLADNPGGVNLLEFVEYYCWVQGTTANDLKRQLPQTEEGWKELEKNKTLYYQWVPFMLGFQCILFYLPRVVWQLVYRNRLGTDVLHLISRANDAARVMDLSSRQKMVTQIALNFEAMLLQNREHRTGKVAEARQKFYRFCSLLMVSKRMGKDLVIGYLILKVLFVVNCIGQIVLMKHFIGGEQVSLFFGIEVLHNIALGRDWTTTLTFPRVGYCYTRVKQMGAMNPVTAQCVLPVNMLIEKIFLFLWFWILLTALITMASIPVWYIRMAYEWSHKAFLKKYLLLGEAIKRTDNSAEALSEFSKKFLRQDGVFLLHMLKINAGDMILSDIVCELWKIYKKKHRGRDLNQASDHDTLSQGHGSTVVIKMTSPTIPSAPKMPRTDSSIMEETRKRTRTFSYT